jgi:hypothetical protein
MNEYQFVISSAVGSERTETHSFTSRLSAITYGQRLLGRGGMVRVGAVGEADIEWLGSWTRPDDHPAWEADE